MTAPGMFVGVPKNANRRDHQMFKRLFAAPVQVSAHCDLPCGIYDPAQAKIEAESVKACMVKAAASGDADFKARALSIKEERSDLVKHHLWVLWTDYFKPPHVETFPDLHSLFWNAAKLCSKVKQEVNLEAANQLVATCEKVVEMFAQTQPK